MPATQGNAPIAAGSSATWKVMFTNAGKVPENFSATQYGAGGPSVYTWGLPGVPSGWVTSNASSFRDVQPGQAVTVTVTVTVAKNAAAGLYGGTFMGTATATSAGSGNIQNAVGAGDREYTSRPPADHAHAGPRDPPPFARNALANGRRFGVADLGVPGEGLPGRGR